MNFQCQVCRRQTFILAVAYLAILVSLALYSSLRLPYSMLYDASRNTHELHAKMMMINVQRGREASEYIGSANFSGLFRRLQKAKHPKFCFVIVSVRRHNKHDTLYLTQVVARLAPQVLNENATLVVYNAEGSTHTEALDLSKFIPVVHAKEETINKQQLTIDKYDKKRLDYISSLQLCLEQEAKYAVILEDDALPAKDFMLRLKYVLQHRVLRDDKSWAFLRLFYPEKYQGWGNDSWIVAELILDVVLMATLLTALSVISLPPTESFKQVLKAQCGLWRHRWIVLFRFSLSCALSLSLLFVVGRPHLLELRKVSVHLTSVVEAPGCCIQGVVYPNVHLKAVVSYLQSVHCSKGGYPVDIALDDFPKKLGLKKWLVVPNMMTHIGMVSSLPRMGLKTSREMAFLLERQP